MPSAPPLFSHINLLFALLRRWIGLWATGKPSARMIAVLERTEAELASAIRETLAEDGVAFPDLDDPAFLRWFAKNCPGSESQAIPGTRHRGVSGTQSHTLVKGVFVLACGQTRNGPSLERRFPARFDIAGRMPAVRHARAPPQGGAKSKRKSRLAHASAAAGAGRTRLLRAGAGGRIAAMLGSG